MTSKKAIISSAAPAPIGPYSQAIESNGTIYISGQIAIDQATGSLLTGSIEEETHQVMKNLKAILEEADLSIDSIVKCSIFIKDMDQFAAINTVYAGYFEETPPARETVEVVRLPKDVNVEISAIASRQI
ncbi:MAG: RidA family protein [Flavobacteriales bacterium]|nr:RidA family protein [Flavobacteriales bacterium]